MDVYSPTSRTEAEQVEALGRVAFSAIALGNWPEASEAAEACLAVATATGRQELIALCEAAAGIVTAVQGDGRAARALLERSERTAARRGMTGLLDMVQLGRGIEALSGARYDEAWAQLRQLVDSAATTSPWVRLVALSYLAEAGLHRGSELSASTVLVTVERLADQASAPTLQGATAYARAITEHQEAADATFDRALDECPVDRAFDRARINLARGVRLRRERRVAESRLPLHEALVAFERLGATAWADQARGQLRATGARRLHRELGATEELTAQELQIVQMAAQGMSNREIGQQLFLSHRTIGSHLYRAFPKLGVAARSQLRDALAGFAEEDSPLLRVSH